MTPVPTAMAILTEIATVTTGSILTYDFTLDDGTDSKIIYNADPDGGWYLNGFLVGKEKASNAHEIFLRSKTAVQTVVVPK